MKSPSPRPVPILMYHSIDTQASPQFKAFVISPETLDTQLAYLAENNYTAMTVTEFVQARASSTLPPQPIILTFDDGFADFYINAYPILKKYALNATLYVVTGFIGETSQWLDREQESSRPMLTWDHLKEICEGGIECGGHTHTHVPLDRLHRERIVEEITAGKRLLESNLDRKITSFAYPYGFYTKLAKQLVTLAGYTSACAVRYRLSSDQEDPFVLSRIIVTPDTDIDKFDALITGRASLRFLELRSRVWRFVRRSI